MTGLMLLAMIERLGARSMVIAGNEMRNSDFVRNDRTRCYWCKQELFQSLKAIARAGRAEAGD